MGSGMMPRSTAGVRSLAASQGGLRMEMKRFGGDPDISMNMPNKNMKKHVEAQFCQ